MKSVLHAGIWADGRYTPYISNITTTYKFSSFGCVAMGAERHTRSFLPFQYHIPVSIQKWCRLTLRTEILGPHAWHRQKRAVFFLTRPWIFCARWKSVLLLRWFVERHSTLIGEMNTVTGTAGLSAPQEMWIMRCSF